MLRSLRFYWKVHTAVVLAAAVAAAVLCGALLVGDSMRGSLRALVLDRLGAIDHALLATRFFDASLAERLPVEQAAPLITLRGAVTVPESGARASGVGIYGIDARFVGLFPDGFAIDRADGQVFQSAVLNAALAAELGVEAGDDLVLSFERYSSIPRDALMGDADPADQLSTLRATVREVIADRGAGRFGLSAQQQVPKIAYVPLPVLQRVVDQRGRVNAVVTAGETAGPTSNDLSERIARVLILEDLGLVLREEPEYLAVENERFVFADDLVETIDEAAAAAGATTTRIQTYLGNAIRANGREVPYSLLAAIDPPDGPPSLVLRSPDGTRLAASDDGILLNEWTAAELAATPGDRIEIEFFSVGPREELTTRTAAFTLEGIAAIDGLGADNRLTPEYPGIQDADDMSEWDPPFPIDLGKIRRQDEEYWDRYEATPKGFLSYAAGRRLWDSRWGTVNAIRVVPPAGGSVAQTTQEFRRELGSRISPENFGMAARAIREEGLAASTGATDFSGLFVAFSFFLIVAAGMLIGLLFRLGVEQRAREIGLLLAVGYGVRAVRRRLLAEGALLALIGAAAGAGLGVGYAWLMLSGLRTLWLRAVGSTEIVLFVKPVSLAVGAAIAVVVVLLSIAGTVLRLSKLPCPALLAANVRPQGTARRRRITPLLFGAGLVGGLGLLAAALVSGKTSSPAMAFGTGASLLVAGLAGFALWARSRGRPATSGGVAPMAARNSRWNPGRSLLSVALVACASFVIVTVGASRVSYGDELLERSSGTGGFTLMAQSDVALYQQLDRRSDRLELGFSDEDDALLAGATTYPFRLLPGDDASCLNLYVPEKPRVLGVPPELVERGGFTFKQRIEGAPADDPWGVLAMTFEDGAVPAVVDTNSAQWILKKKIGDTIEVAGDDGTTVRLRIAGTLEKGIFQSELLIAESRYLEHFGDHAGYGYFLIDAPPDEAAEIGNALERNLAPFGFDVTTTREKLEAYQAVEHTYMSTFQLLGGFGLLLGTGGLGIVMIRNVLERRRELAILRAFGFARDRLSGMVLLENGFLLLCGVGIGSLAALIAVLPRLSAIHMPWGSLGLTLAAVLAAGMLSGVLAARVVARVPLLPALKSEA